MGTRIKVKPLQPLCSKPTGKYLIVYDVDDVLNNLNGYILTKLGLPEPNRYNVMECSMYTSEQKEQILQMYREAETFKHLEYVPGAKEICDIEKSGRAEVMINSSCLSEEVAEVKLHSLLTHVDNLKESKIHFDLTNASNRKRTIDGADIVIEDCLANLQRYGEDTRKILINKSNNQAAEYGTCDLKDSIIRVNSLLEANEVVRRLVLGLNV